MNHSGEQPVERGKKADPAQQDGVVWNFREHKTAQPLQGQTLKMLPTRYLVKDEEKDRFLTCVEAPNIHIVVDRQFCVSSAAAKKYPEGSIFLDGAAKGEPFLDVQHKIYNLDHHEGCVRAFTLSTCEQAVVLILKGLDLGVGDWTVFANEPDLDTVLAIWLILNHMRFGGEDPEIRKKLMPFIRLQGVIDSHGFELKELTGFPEHLQTLSLTQIETARAVELELKKSGQWGTTDELEYVAALLRTIDEMVYSSWHFDGMGKINELFRIKIGEEKIAVGCSSDEGIYETEEYLKKTHGSRLGLIFLQKSVNTYTVRQVDPFLPTNLNRLYDRLNVLDPAVTPTSSWAGSEEIGGSPRLSGTQLDIAEIKKICSWVYNKPSFMDRLKTACAGMLLATFIFLISLCLVHLIFPSLPWVRFNQEENLLEMVIFFGLVTILSLVFMMFEKKHSLRFYGFSRIREWTWVLFLPIPVFAGFYLGYFPKSLGGIIKAPLLFSLFLLGPLAMEFLFRGAMLGLLHKNMFTMRYHGRWFLSGPNLLTALAFTVAVNAFFVSKTPMEAYIPGSIWLCSGVAFLAGLVFGFARERSESIFSSLILHYLSVIVAVYVVPFYHP